MRLGFVGLGTMGGAMAGHWVRSGADITVWNRTSSRCESLASQGAKVAFSLIEVGKSCDLIAICINTVEDVRGVLPELLESAKPGTIFVDHSTLTPDSAVEFSALCAGKGCHYMDAPVTGGSMGAKAGTLTIFCGGTADIFEKCLPYLEVYGKKVAHVGPTGAGQWMKLANQIAVGGALLSLCESLNFAQKAGLNIEQTRELLGSGAGGSWAMEHYGKMILAEDWTPGFSVQNQRKDFGYCFDAASEIGASIPTTRIADDLLARLEAAGRGADTTAALFDVYQGKVEKA